VTLPLAFSTSPHLRAYYLPEAHLHSFPPRPFGLPSVIAFLPSGPSSFRLSALSDLSLCDLKVTSVVTHQLPQELVSFPSSLLDILLAFSTTLSAHTSFCTSLTLVHLHAPRFHLYILRVKLLLLSLSSIQPVQSLPLPQKRFAAVIVTATAMHTSMCFILASSYIFSHIESMMRSS